MKDDGLRSAACLLTPEEQRMLFMPDEKFWQDEFAQDVETAAGLRALLAELEASIGALLRLLKRRRTADLFPPDVRADYAGLVDRIESATARVAALTATSADAPGTGCPSFVWDVPSRRQ